ncbi:hypothetical protein GCM10014715_87220 [Streptomyces spiralis]|uniref:Transposase IS4-like domain-containing protein n=1 Tax=Streptomyces spiralis TaxID=66376 RepID=A0A919E6T2_9ACTN|nr:hypothetical protein GCM10014715_87220 [Streptomyces spiralis]
MPRIARRGKESSGRLGRHRWVIERTPSWLGGCRRLHRRYERKTEHFLAFVGLAGALLCYRHDGPPGPTHCVKERTAGRSTGSEVEPRLRS